MTDAEYKLIAENKIEIIKEKSKGRNLYIYGAGKGGQLLLEVFNAHQVDITGYVDRNKDKKVYNNLPVINLKKINPCKDYLIISLMNYERNLVYELEYQGLNDNDYYIIVAGELLNKKDIEYQGCKVGAYTYGYESFCEYGVVSNIGRYCSINYTARAVDNHWTGGVSTHPFLECYIDFPWEKRDERKKFIDNKISTNKVSVGNDVWIGANVVVLPGVTIGDGVIIGAGAVITKDLEPYGIYGGVPAKLIKYRFSQDIIRKMEEIKWWNWDRELIEKNIKYFYEPSLFVKKFSK